MGREREIEVLSAMLNRVLEGAGGVVLIGGEAGIGKTSLVDALIQQAARHGTFHLTGHCYDNTISRPYRPWIEITDSYRPEPGMPALPQVFTDRTVFQTLRNRGALFDTLWGFLQDLARERPLIIVLEDQQWADEASLDFTRFAAQQIAECPILILMTYRDNEITRDQPLYRYLPQIVRDARAERITLQRIDRGAISDLVRGRYTLPETDTELLVNYLVHYADGNPFFIEELLQSLEYDRLLVLQDGDWVFKGASSAQVPPLVRQIIDNHLSWLNELSRQQLQVAAVIGVQVPLDLWQRVLGISHGELSDLVDEAVQASLLEETGDTTTLRFRHALIRETLYEQLILPRRREWHRKVAEALEQTPAPDPDAVAHHFRAAGDPRAATWLIRAGERAIRAFATGIASERYEEALMLLSAADDDSLARQARLRCDLAELYRYTNPRRALEHLDAVRPALDRIADDGLAATLRWTTGRMRGFLGEDAVDDVMQAIEQYEATDPNDDDPRTPVAPFDRGTLSQWLAHHGMYRAALTIADEILAEHQGAAADSATTNQVRANSWYTRGLAHAALGDPASSRRAFLQARQLYVETEYDFMASAVTKWELVEAVLNYEADDPDLRRRLTEEYRESWRRSPFGNEVRPHHALFTVDILEGRWDEAYENAQVLLQHHFMPPDCLAALGEIERLRGARSMAWSRVRQGVPDGPSTNARNLYFVRRLALYRLAAALALDEGDFDETLTWLDHHDRWLDWAERVPDRSASRLLRARIEFVRGAHQQAIDIASEALELARSPRQPLPLLVAERLLGRLSIATGQHDLARKHLNHALKLSQQIAAPFEEAVNHLCLAELAIATGDSTAAQRELATVRRICEPLGARPVLELADQFESRLDHAGAASAADTVGLSPRELEVLQLVARGLTDAEVAEQLFISPRTVGRHLQSIYGKLGVNSRTAATAIAFERRLI